MVRVITECNRMNLTRETGRVKDLDEEKWKSPQSLLLIGANTNVELRSRVGQDPINTFSNVSSMLV